MCIKYMCIKNRVDNSFYHFMIKKLKILFTQPHYEWKRRTREFSRLGSRGETCKFVEIT